MVVTRNSDGLYPPQYPCYKKPEQFCRMRQFPDSEFACVKNPDTCMFSAKPQTNIQRDLPIP